MDVGGVGEADHDVKFLQLHVDGVVVLDEEDLHLILQKVWSVCLCLYLCLCDCWFVCVFVGLYLRLWVCLCIYGFLFVGLYLCLCVCGFVFFFKFSPLSLLNPFKTQKLKINPPNPQKPLNTQKKPHPHLFTKHPENPHPH